MKLIEAETLIEDENFSEIISVTTEALDETTDSELIPYLLFHRSYAYIQELEFAKAIEDLEAAIQYDERIPEMYHNLAILYSQQGASTQEIEDIINEGLEQFPGNEELSNIKNKLQSY